LRDIKGEALGKQTTEQTIDEQANDEDSFVARLFATRLFVDSVLEHFQNQEGQTITIFEI
jgi:hypothetical protein